MFRTITDSMGPYPPWAGTSEKPSRYRYFDQLDKMLDGTFYDHLRYDFYTEDRVNGQPIPLVERRPSSRYHAPRMVARWSARKLWAGRHMPRIHHSDPSITRVLDQLVQTTKLDQVMMNATMLGSVGSVAITFSIDRSRDPMVALKVWRAKNALPTLDDYDNLVNLRVYYLALGRSLMERGVATASDGNPIQPEMNYWWIRDYGTMQEITWVPCNADDWNPVQGWLKPGQQRPLTVVAHSLGFVPGVWVRNLSGCTSFDGVGTWDDAKDIAIEIDYLLSQASRGTRYNCAPELVLVGDLVNGDIERSVQSYIHLKAGVKDETGVAFGEGKAMLLEMSGSGLKAAIELISNLRNMMLEQVGATRKDPEKLKGVMSGRAMEFLDEDSHDLVMELRSSYGSGTLELVRKIVRALGDVGDPKGVMLGWPRLYQPTPEDLSHLIPALVLAATPIQKPLEPEEAATISGGSGGVDAGESTKTAETRTSKAADGSSTSVKKEVQKGPGTQGGRPSAAPTGGEIIGSLLEIDQASQYLKLIMDIDLLPDSESEGVSDSDEDTGTTPPPEGDPEATPGDHGGVGTTYMNSAMDEGMAE